ncbi:hypothetical protein P154DRAFT_589227 [Amniculicola lignicola CBS 123094]|uniref:Uncharacterized protein n=1 Tax=Amniculicola lignicola CBS 123094 TaxID=1392246 RepID=A0A6A5VUH8_9PLEO|nr:hypothetical protein P154DRAFT_589227 [Amniculicola lignicola CBS 123094]
MANPAESPTIPTKTLESETSKKSRLGKLFKSRNKSSPLKTDAGCAKVTSPTYTSLPYSFQTPSPCKSPRDRAGTRGSEDLKPGFEKVGVFPSERSTLASSSDINVQIRESIAAREVAEQAEDVKCLSVPHSIDHDLEPDAIIAKKEGDQKEEEKRTITMKVLPQGAEDNQDETVANVIEEEDGQNDAISDKATGKIVAPSLIESSVKDEGVQEAEERRSDEAVHEGDTESQNTSPIEETSQNPVNSGNIDETDSSLAAQLPTDDDAAFTSIDNFNDTTDAVRTDYHPPAATESEIWPFTLTIGAIQITSPANLFQKAVGDGASEEDFLLGPAKELVLNMVDNVQEVRKVVVLIGFGVGVIGRTVQVGFKAGYQWAAYIEP